MENTSDARTHNSVDPSRADCTTQLSLEEQQASRSCQLATAAVISGHVKGALLRPELSPPERPASQWRGSGAASSTNRSGSERDARRNDPSYLIWNVLQR